VGCPVIDLHTHSTASDGTDSPDELVRRAASLGLEALAITDHDTFAGSDAAAPVAASLGLPFVKGLEVSTRLLEEADPACRSVHILGYFFEEPAQDFREWLETLKNQRRTRNELMAAKLRSLGMEVTVEEAEKLGQNITGRPHFARILREKGYVSSLEDAFRRYLGERGEAYVEREDPPAQEGIRRIVAAGGLASLAHPARLNQPQARREEEIIRGFVSAGLGALEVWHPDHDESDRSRYANLARKYDLAVSGGSDYHGEHKPNHLLGRGNGGGHRVPLSVLNDLRVRATNRERSSRVGELSS
jgi:3',5'-nucleoside bisphosphate phosphatase